MITTEDLMIHALKRGILIADFNVLSVGMILDYINQYDQICHTDNIVDKEFLQLAKQKDFDGF